MATRIRARAVPGRGSEPPFLWHVLCARLPPGPTAHGHLPSEALLPQPRKVGEHLELWGKLRRRGSATYPRSLGSYVGTLGVHPAGGSGLLSD